MTTARHAASRAGSRHRRRLARQRLFREELAAVVVLVVALLVTIVLLGLQWLQGGQSNAVGIGIHLLGASHGGFL